jgi:PAS domain S-box-containing protein
MSAKGEVTAPGIDTARVLELAVEASPSGLLVVDSNGTIVLVNRELERQFGYSREELVGQVVDVLLPESLRPIHAVHRSGFLHTPQARPKGGRDFVGRRKDGSDIAIEIGLKPIETPDGMLVLASVVDISERRRSAADHSAALAAQVDFERLVAELSAQFINIPVNQMIDAMRTGLGRICEQLGLDRSTLHRIGPEGKASAPVVWPAPGPIEDESTLESERFPWSLERILAGGTVSFSNCDEVPSAIDRASYLENGTAAAMIVPLSVAGRIAGALSFSCIHAGRTWPPDAAHRVKVVASVFAQVLARQERDEAAQAATAEEQRLKDRLQVENKYLRRETHERLGLTRVVGQSAAIRRVLDLVRQVAATDSTVLLIGETGTGKELFATQIHELSARQGRAMVRVNCAAIPSTLIESELFGREKGAYTGALVRQVGRFELGHHSTILLDEVGDLPLDVQVKLLRVLEERQIERLGSPKPITVDTRIIAATHRNLEKLMTEGTFREDLYYRLSVFPIQVPPLRERVEDIPLLVWRFVEEFSRAFGKPVDAIDRDILAALQQYSWPGNIRELRNVVERAMIQATSRRLTLPVPRAAATAFKRSVKLVDVERQHIRAVIESAGWRIRGAGGAADRLGLKPTTLETRMAKLGIKRPGHG